MSKDKKEINSIYQKIDDISINIGIESKDKTVFEIISTDDPKQRKLNLKSGSWESNEPWFAIDENQNLHTLVSIKTLTNFLDTLKSIQQENFNLKLEKTIWQHIPVDFQDVWVVAMDEIKSIALEKKEVTAINVNLEKLILNIKKKHPNLFVDLQDFMNSKRIKKINEDMNND